MDGPSLNINNQMLPLVSVIMSVHNGEAYLQEAIDSICDQTYLHWECIIIDDASNEPTQFILSRYVNDKRFIVKRKDIQQGLTKNLNEAIQMATGQFIARMDADDISLSNRFQEQVDYLLKHPEVSVVASFIDMINEKGDLLGIWNDDRLASTYRKIKRKLPFANCIAHPSVMIRKDVFVTIRYNELQTHSQDWDLWLRLIANKFVIEKLNKVLLQYRVHDTSITYFRNKKSSFYKKNVVYKMYLQSLQSEEKATCFNIEVRFAFYINKIKWLLSSVKRKIFS